MHNFDLNSHDCSYDFYDILNVTKSASHDEIRFNYLELSKLWHPDKRKSPLSIDSSDSMYVDESPFLKIKTAYTILSDPVLRKLYDKYGHKATEIAQSVYTENASTRRQHADQGDTICDKAFWDESLDHDSYSVVDHNKTSKSDDMKDNVNNRVRDLLRNQFHQSLLNSPISFFTDSTLGLKYNSLYIDDQDRFLRRPYLTFNKSILTGNLNIALTDKSSTQIGYELRNDDNHCTNVITAFFNRKIWGFLCRVGFQTYDPSTFGKKCLYISRNVSPLYYFSQFISIEGDLYNSRTYFSKQLTKNQKVELAYGVNEDSGISYKYKQFGSYNIEYMFNVTLTTTDLTSYLRAKYRNDSSSKLTLGYKGTYSYLKGLIFEYYIRFYTFVETMHKFKIEYRLSWKPGYVGILCKIGLANSRIQVPIELFSMPDNVNYSIHLASIIALSSMISPVLYHYAKNFIAEKFGYNKNDKNYYFFDGLDELLNFDYLTEFDTTGMFDSAYEHEGINLNVIRARNECFELFPVAKKVAFSENAINGLVIKYAFYGHPTYVKKLSSLADKTCICADWSTNHIFGVIMGPLLFDTESPMKLKLISDDSSLSNIYKSDVFCESVDISNVATNDYNESSPKNKLFFDLTNEDMILCKQLVIDVTSALQTRVGIIFI